MMAKRVTLKQVAARANVSYQTVSKVINGKGDVSSATEERIWHAVHELGYRPHHMARSLRSRRALTIGYSWPPSTPDQPNPILDQFLQSMLLAAEREGYYLLSFPHFFDQYDQIEAYKKLIDSNRVDGFVISAVEYDDRRVAFLIERDIPFVAFGRSNHDWDFPYVDVDGAFGLTIATDHLLEQGHRRIAILAWPEHSRSGDDRLHGYLTALEKAGLESHPSWIARGEGCFEFGFETTMKWLQSPHEQRPTAIVALNDSMAIGAMHAAKELGVRIGPELGIVGFDDTPFICHLTPPLSSLRQPVWEAGQDVIGLLVAILENKHIERRQILLSPELVIRESSLVSPEGKDGRLE